MVEFVGNFASHVRESVDDDGAAVVVYLKRYVNSVPSSGNRKFTDGIR
ncbi:hypothetical protein [Arcanobacterium haemolyticum]